MGLNNGLTIERKWGWMWFYLGDLRLGAMDSSLIFVSILGERGMCSVVDCGFEGCFFLYKGFVKR